jgi:hypothetical protein
MDSASIAHRLAKLQELHDCWRFIQGSKKRPPGENSDASPISESHRQSDA